MNPDHPEISEFHKPVLLVFLVWVTRQHTDALVTLCGLKLVGSRMKIGNLIEVFQYCSDDWKAAQQHIDTLEKGSPEENEMIRTGFLELTGFENETVDQIRKQLQI